MARLTDLGWGQRLRTLLGDDGVGGVATLADDLEAPPLRRTRTPRRGSPGSSGPPVSDVPPDDELMKACARVLGAWNWAQRPGAVVAMPSRRRPALVAGVAQGLAASAGCLFWVR